jgi:ubiquinone/menaquinone biosynthesis C-methylase UbiE
LESTLGDCIMETKNSDTIWTLDEDATAWSIWAENMAQAPPSALMQELIANHRVTQKSWALDLGCGTGRAFLPLVEAGYQVIGLDLTVKCAEISRQRASQAQISAYPILTSAAQLPIQSSSIDFVLAMSCLFHLGSLELPDALLEIYRVLVPGGSAILHFLDLEDWRRSLARQICHEQAPMPSYQAVVTCFCSTRKAQEWIKQAGLELDKLEMHASTTSNGQQRNWLAYCAKHAS